MDGAYFHDSVQLFPEEDYNWHFKRMPDFVDDIYSAIVPLQDARRSSTPIGIVLRYKYI